MCILKPLELARPTLPSISSRAPDETHYLLLTPQQDHGELLRSSMNSTGVLEGVLGQRRVHLLEEDSLQVEARARITCHVV